MIVIILGIVAGVLLALTIAIFNDYRRHRRPLEAVDPDVHYSLAHHIRIVTFPLLKYRISISLQPKSDKINHF